MIVCIPSRERPEKFSDLLYSIMRTATMSCQFYIRLDEDDPRRSDYSFVREFALKHGDVRIEIGPRADLAGIIQECLARYPDEDCYARIDDDVVAHTVGWDQTLHDAAGPWGISYPDDGVQGEKLATHPFIGGDLLRAFGFWALPGLSHLYTDTVWDFIGRQYGNLVYRHDVFLEHRHWCVGKSERDHTYDKPKAAQDRARFQQWISEFQIDPTLAAKIGKEKCSLLPA